MLPDGKSFSNIIQVMYMTGTGMKRLINFLANIYRHRHMINIMARREFETRYVGTLGGALWAIAHPVALVAVFWLVFSVGFKVQGPNNSPFILYFVSGLVPWLMFNEVLGASANGVIRNVHLVKKTIFPTEILPLVYLAAGAISHVVFLLIMLALFAVHDVTFSIYMFQVLYYFVALCFFLLGISWIVSALNVFHRDIGQGLTVILNLWFWLTPIVWTIDIVPEKYHWLLQLNPLWYVIDGYRKSLLYQQPVWADVTASAYYWLAAAVIFVVGALLFRRLKPEFADVL